MFKWKLPAIWEAIAILIGTIIGGGVFVLPYVNYKSGLISTNIWLLIVGGFLILSHLIFGEIVSRTKKEYKLPGYAGHYLGSHVKKFLGLISTIALSFSLIIYLVLGNKFAQIIFFNSWTAIKPYTFVLVWMAFNVCLLFSIHDMSKLNFVLTFSLVFLMVALSVLCIAKIQIIGVNTSLLMPVKNWILPYGVIFFALDGLAAVPIMFTCLKKNKAKKVSYARSIIIGFVLLVLLYGLFMNSISILSRTNSSQDAITGLIPFLGRNVILIGAVIGLLAIWTSYITFAHYFKDMFVQDFKTSQIMGIVLVLILPLVFLFFDMNKIEELMALSGGIIGGIMSVTILFIYFKAQKEGDRKPIYNLNLPAWFLFGFGIILFISSVSELIMKIFKL